MPPTQTIIVLQEEEEEQRQTNHSQECPDDYLLPTGYYSSSQMATKLQQNSSGVRCAGARCCTGSVRSSGEHVVRPLPVDARRLRRRPEDDVEGVHDAGDIAQYRQHEGDEELRLQKHQQNRKVIKQLARP